MIEIITDLQKNPLVKWIYMSEENYWAIQKETNITENLIVTNIPDNEIKIILYGA